jgi:polyisoprenoid-binding protein YceI
VTQSFEPTPSPTPPQRSSEDGLPWIRTILLALVVAALIGGMAVVWYIFFRPAGPAPVGTGAPVIPGASAPVTSSAEPTVTVTPTVAPAGTPVPAGALDGTWSVDPSLGSFDYDAGDFSGSWVGYRVQEQLVGLAGSTAVGRTPDVTGSLVIDGATIPEASFEADLATLQSDEPARDGQLRRQGVQTDRFPSATFVLTEPIELGVLPAGGQDVAVAATGDLTIHGVTRPVTIELHAALHGDVIAAVGSLTFSWDDFGMDRPTAARVVSLGDDVTMEAQLFFTKEG